MFLFTDLCENIFNMFKDFFSSYCSDTSMNKMKFKGHFFKIKDMVPFFCVRFATTAVFRYRNTDLRNTLVTQQLVS